MLPASKVTYIESDGQPVTRRSIVWHHYENWTLKTIQMLSVQTYPTCSKNGEEIRKLLQYVHNAGIHRKYYKNLENIGFQIGKNRASNGMLKWGV